MLGELLPQEGLVGLLVGRLGDRVDQLIWCICWTVAADSTDPRKATPTR